MKENVFIFHGTEGHPEENWFPWLRGELEAMGHKVFVPQFPSPPVVPAKIAEWFGVLKDYEKDINEDTIIIGHSLGGDFLLKLLETISHPIKLAVFVGTPIGVRPILNYDRDIAFGGFDFGWENIKNKAKNFEVFQSDNDPYVCLGNGEELAKNLGVKLNFIPNAGHFNAKAGFLEFPELFKKLLDPKEKFLEIQELFKRMSHEQVIPVIESYYIWRTLVFSRSVIEVGKEKAEENVKLISTYKDFFLPTEQSHLHLFIVGLVKFFDKNNKSLSLRNLIKKLIFSKDLLTSDVFRELYPHLHDVRPIEETYIPIEEESIKYFEMFIEKYENIISNLKNIRDKQLAHTDVEVIAGKFVPQEIEDIIRFVQEMFNKLSSNFDRSHTIWDHLEKDAINHTNFLLESLQKGENARKEEIRKKW